MIRKLSISRKEFYIVIAITACIVFISFIPFIYGNSVSQNRYFTGKTINSKYDLYTYLSWIQQAREGSIFFEQLYTSESQPQILFHPIFFIAGYLANILDISNIAMYQIVRAISAAIFLIITYLLICKFLLLKHQRLFAFLLICTSSGLGFLFKPTESALWIYEFNTFTTILNTVLDPIGLTIVFCIFLIYIEYFEQRNFKILVYSGILVNLLAIVHTYDLVIVFSIIFTHSLYKFIYTVDKISLLNTLYLIILSFPAILWQVFVLGENTNFGIWAFVQSNVASSNLYTILLQFGLLSILGLIGAFLIYYKRDKNKYFLLIWMIVGIFIMYSPILSTFQRKFGAGYHVILCIASTVTIFWLLDFFLAKQTYLKKFSILSFIIVYFSITNIYTLFITTSLYNNNHKPFYISHDEYESIFWLKENALPKSVVLADYDISNIIPGLSGMKVYAGHYDQTVNIESKYNFFNKFTSSFSKNDPLKFFVYTEHVKFILVDQAFRAKGGLNTTNRPYLNLVFDNQDVQIYEINQDMLSLSHSQ